MKTDPDLPSDIGPYKKQDVKVPAKQQSSGIPRIVQISVPILIALFWLMLLMPLFGLLIGFSVDTFMTFYNFARDAT